MRILELFAGIGACSTALKRLGIDLEIVDAVEIDKYAMASFNAIHGTNFESQDITKWNKELKDIDIITHGSPCQDFSLAGKQAGGDIGSGTRSSLMYETIRIVGQVRPKYVLWENVKNILSAKHKHNFDAYIETMKVLGYNSYYQVLNAKDYGIPQNRERVYTISIRRDIDKGYIFPVKEELKLRLKDMLEDEVDEKYYLSESSVKNLQRNFGSKAKEVELDGICDTLQATMGNGGGNVPVLKQIGTLDIKGHDCVKRVYSGEGIAPTLTDMQGGNRQPKIIVDEPVIAASRGRNPDRPGDRTPGIPTEQRLEINRQGISNTITTVQKDNYVIEPCLKIKEATKAGFKEAYAGDGVNISGRMKYQRGNVQKEMTQTLMANGSERGVVTPDMRIRKLTPRECWRLMGFGDEDFEKAANVPTSNTQLYKQAREQYRCKCFREDI